jgi:hypothetical protein
MNRERAETHLGLPSEEELCRGATRPADSTSGSRPEDEAVRSASVTGTVAGGAAVPDAFMASTPGMGRRSCGQRALLCALPGAGAPCRPAGGDVQTAEEVVQDSFAAWRGGWQRLADADTALAYLRPAVVNRSRSVLRHRPVLCNSPQQVLPCGSDSEHWARVARVARALTARPGSTRTAAARPSSPGRTPPGRARRLGTGDGTRPDPRRPPRPAR